MILLVARRSACSRRLVKKGIATERSERYKSLLARRGAIRSDLFMADEYKWQGGRSAFGYLLSMLTVSKDGFQGGL